MSELSIKLPLWVMSQLIASSTRGISIEELSRKWKNSSLNDDGKPLPERSFFRLRRTLEYVFGIEIEFVKSDVTRYRIAQQDLGPGNHGLLDLIISKTVDKDESGSSTLRDIMGLLLNGSELAEEDMTDLKTISRTLQNIPFEYGQRLIAAVENGEIPGADSAGWDSGYSRYVCVWNKSDYRRTDLWLSVGISDFAVYFYIVTSVQDPEYRERVARLLHLDNGERYRHGYWWYEPEDKSLFSLEFKTFPDFVDVERRIEGLIHSIAALPQDLRKPEEKE